LRCFSTAPAQGELLIECHSRNAAKLGRNETSIEGSTHLSALGMLPTIAHFSPTSRLAKNDSSVSYQITSLPLRCLARARLRQLPRNSGCPYCEKAKPNLLQNSTYPVVPYFLCSCQEKNAKMATFFPFVRRWILCPFVSEFYNNFLPEKSSSICCTLMTSLQ